MWALLLPTGQGFSCAGGRQSPGWNSLWALWDRPLCTWQVPGAVTFSCSLSGGRFSWAAPCWGLEGVPEGRGQPCFMGLTTSAPWLCYWSEHCTECPGYDIIPEQLGMLKNHILLCAWLGWEGTSVRGADWRGSLACLTALFWPLEESLIKALKLQISLPIVTSLLQALSCQNPDAFLVHLVPSEKYWGSLSVPVAPWLLQLHEPESSDWILFSLDWWPITIAMIISL